MRPERLRLGAYLFLVAVVAFSFWVNHQQDIERCRDRNASTEDSVRIMAEALIAASSDAPPDRVDAFLDDLDDRLARVRVECT